MRIILSLKTAGAAMLTVAAVMAADDALAGRGGGSRGGFHGAYRNGQAGWNRSFLPAPGQMNTGGQWVGGSSFGEVGMHWVPNRGGGYGSGYSGYGGLDRASQFGAGRDGFGANNGGFFHRNGFRRRFGRGNDNGGGGGGGYWGGGGVWYGDDYGSDYPSYDTGYYPAFGSLPPPPAYESAPVSTYASSPAPRVTYAPTILNVSAPAAPNPHIIYLNDEPSRKSIRHDPEHRP